MATEIRVPTLGESVSEATVGTWFKKVGDAVKADEILCELETDKVTVEVPAPASGTLSEIVANAGETVAPGGLLGNIAEGAVADAAPAATPAEPAKVEAAPATPQAPAAPAAPAAAPATSIPPAPSASKLMADSNVAAADVEGSGKRGQVLKEDVLAAISKGPSAPAAAPAASVRDR